MIAAIGLNAKWVRQCHDFDADSPRSESSKDDASGPGGGPVPDLRQANDFRERGSVVAGPIVVLPVRIDSQVARVDSYA